MKRKALIFISLIALLYFAVAASTIVQTTRIKNDPCYRIIDGKPPGYIVEADRVCVPESAGQYESYFRTLEGVDVATFEEVGAGFAKDARHVYYGDAVEDRFDPKTFRHIGNGYVADRALVAYYDRFLEGADPKTFAVFPGNYYARDEKQVYFHDRAIPGADPLSFEVLASQDAYGRDRARVYYSGRIIREADPASLVFLNDRVTKDRRHVFCTGSFLDGLDAETFKQIGGSDYLRDGDTLYYCEKKVEGVDVDALQVFPASKSDQKNRTIAFSPDACGTDGKSVVCYGEIQRWEDPKEFFSGEIPELPPYFE